MYEEFVWKVSSHSARLFISSKNRRTRKKLNEKFLTFLLYSRVMFVTPASSIAHKSNTKLVLSFDFFAPSSPGQVFLASVLLLNIYPAFLFHPSHTQPKRRHCRKWLHARELNFSALTSVLLLASFFFRVQFQIEGIFHSASRAVLPCAQSWTLGRSWKKWKAESKWIN